MSELYEMLFKLLNNLRDVFTAGEVAACKCSLRDISLSLFKFVVELTRCCLILLNNLFNAFSK